MEHLDSGVEHDAEKVYRILHSHAHCNLLVINNLVFDRIDTHLADVCDIGYFLFIEMHR